MLHQVSFWTPIHYAHKPLSLSQKLRATVDGYFYLGGKVAVPLDQDSQVVILHDGHPSLWKTATKIVSYLTFVLPLIVLYVKVLLRCRHPFYALNLHIAPTEFLSGQAPNIPLNDALAQSHYRQLVMADTLEMLKKQCYRTPSGTIMPINATYQASRASLLRSAGLQGNRPNLHPTQIQVIQQDCLEVAESIAKQGEIPLVLNMAADVAFGGGFLGGARAQEEDLCRRTGLAFALDTQFGYQSTNFYPLSKNGDAAGVYVPDIPVFRAGYDRGYQYLDRPFIIAVATMAAFPNPTLEITPTGERRLSTDIAHRTREKIRTVLEMAYQNGHKTVILSALGAGAFKNPPQHIAELFKEVISSDYSNCFEKILFAIIDDNNTRLPHNPDGNFQPFAQIFNTI
jgi:uncharacterized protein (TIGR02452 family)